MQNFRQLSGKGGGVSEGSFFFFRLHITSHSHRELKTQFEERLKVRKIQDERSTAVSAATRMKLVTQRARLQDIVRQQAHEIKELQEV